ncbi:hypothetical protein ABH942_001166 [Flavobacterium sp. 28YEA47A]
MLIKINYVIVNLKKNKFNIYNVLIFKSAFIGFV